MVMNLFRFFEFESSFINLQEDFLAANAEELPFFDGFFQFIDFYASFFDAFEDDRAIAAERLRVVGKVCVGGHLLVKNI